MSRSNKAPYRGVYICSRDLHDHQILADRVEETLEGADGYYFQGTDQETVDYLKKNTLELFMKIHAVIVGRKNKNES